MSNDFNVLAKAGVEKPAFSHAAAGETAPQSGEYAGLVRRLFQNPAAVAIIAVGNGSRPIGGIRSVTEGIAAELSVSGKRVVIVSMDQLFRMNRMLPSPDTASMTETERNVWQWPSPSPPTTRPITPLEQGVKWLNVLRRNFDAILLDCTALETATAAEAAAPADAAVMVVEAAVSSGERIRQEQLVFQRRGVLLTGCILQQKR